MIVWWIRPSCFTALSEAGLAGLLDFKDMACDPVYHLYHRNPENPLLTKSFYRL